MENYVPNPWLNISWDNPFADGDRDYSVMRGKFKFGSVDYVNHINRNDVIKKKIETGRPVELTFKDCLPEPYYGDINSDVYLLNMNPGEPDYVFCQKNDKQGDYLKYCQAMLNHQPMAPGLLFDKERETIVYDPDKYNKVIDDIFDNKQNMLFKNLDERKKYPLRPHAGDVWQREAWRALRDILKRDPRLFIIEYFPYHSTGGFSFPKDLPSNAYRNYLIRRAIKTKKLIVIMRQARKWYDIKDNNLGKDLENYPNKITLSCKGRIWLTPGNFVIPKRNGNEPDWVCKSIQDVIDKF
jgi:hypothetical protein